MFIDLVWILGWLIVGLFTFQVRGIKHFFSLFSSLISLLSFYGLLFNSSPIIHLLNSIGLNIISGVLTAPIYHLIYLIGANISRYKQFGKMSLRIIIYVLLFFVL